MTLNDVVSPSTIKQLSRSAGVEPAQVRSLLDSALPVLVQAMSENAASEAGANSLANALVDHAASEKSKVSEVDAADGAKILSHILGDSGKSTTKELSKKAGVSSSQGAVILALLAPLLLKALGLQAQQSNTSASGLTDLLGALLGNSSGSSSHSSSNASGSLLSGLLGSLLSQEDEEEEEEIETNDLGGGSLAGTLFDLITGK